MRRSSLLPALVVLVVLVVVVVLPWPGDAQAGRLSILDGSRSLRGKSFETVAFHVSGDWMRNPRVRGSLETSGGGRADVDVLVLHEADLEAWDDNRAVTPLFSAPRVRGLDLDVLLPGPGHYVLVLSNRFSLLKGKTVAGEVVLTWEDDPSLPRGDALRRQVRPVELPPLTDVLSIPVSGRDPVAAVLLDRSAPDSLRIAVHRREGGGMRTASLGAFAGRIEEVGTVDAHGDGDRDVLLVMATRDSLGTRRDLRLVCPRQSATIAISLLWDEEPTAASDMTTGDGETATKTTQPTMRFGAGYAQARFSLEQSVLERLLPAYNREPPRPDVGSVTK